MNTEQERAAFEAWVQREQPAGCVADMARGWQDRAALAATPAAPPPELCEQVCAAIKAADDKSVDEAGYMLDSNDCIAIVREEFARATVAATPKPAQGATYDDATELALGKAYRTIAIDRPWLARDDFEAAYRAGLAATPAPAPQWVPVSERLPEPDSGEVLVWLTGGRCAFDEWHTHREDPIGMSTTHVLDMGCMWRDYEFEEVTHWMPIPAAPEAGLK